MTTDVDVVNRALQAIGTRTTIQSLVENSAEASQASLVYAKTRDQLIRMAPWNCAKNFANAVFITSVPGTPENTTAGTATWQKGQPPPPWAYEYQYPVDCLRELYVVPQFTTGFSGNVPITTAVTGGAPQFWQGPPVKFQVAQDQFFPVTAAAVAAGGAGYAVGETITLVGTPANTAPIGAPVKLFVTAAPAGVIATVSVVNQVLDASPAHGGSYFARQTNPVAQGSSDGAGLGATFNLTYGAKASQRVILTNQEAALLCYNKQVTDPNLMDSLLQEAWVQYLAACLVYQLTSDKDLANLKIAQANNIITIARAGDGNEGLTINDMTPDWIRARGIEYGYTYWTPDQQFSWGPLLAAF